MNQYETIFLDRDGTLNSDPGYISSRRDYNFYDFALPALQELARAGNRFVIVTNQSGVGRGLIAVEVLKEIHDYIREAFAAHGIPLLDIYVCTDHPDRAGAFRKPGVGMFLQAARDHGLRMRRSLMIGDAGSDMESGRRLGMDTMLVLTGKGPDTLASLGPELQPTYVVKNIAAGAQILLEKDNR